MRNRKGAHDWWIVAGVLLIILFGIIIYSTSRGGDDEEDTTGDSDDGDIVNILLDADPDSLIVADSTNYLNWDINYSNIVVDGIPEMQSVQLAEEATIEQGVFSGDKFTQTFIPTNDTVGASLSLVILEKTGGDLEIEINGKEVADQAYSEGDQLKLPLPMEYIVLGEENKIEISVSSPFWLAFWRSYSYKLEGVYLDQKIFHQDEASHAISFPIASNQSAGLTSAKLYAVIDKLSSAESKKINILFNSEEIYSNVPGAVQGSIDIEIPPRLFRVGDNQLIFSTELYGGYNISFDVNMTLLNISEDSYEVYEFKQAADNVWPYIEKGKAGKDYECELRLERESGASSITVWINENRNVWAFPEDGILTENICKHIQRDKNTIMIIAEKGSSEDYDFIDLSKVQLAIRKK